MELPVVASDIHGIPDVVMDGETGILTPARDVDAIADALTSLVNDRALRLRMGAGGRAFVQQHYRWQDNMALLDRLYEDVRANGAQRRA